MTRARARTAGLVLAATAILASVGGPAAVASYRHAYTVAMRYGETEAMARWLPLTTDGMLVAALVVAAVRRHRGQRVGLGPCVAFALGMAATLGANVAAAQWSVGGVLVAVWPPITVALTLELFAALMSSAARAVTPSRPGRDAPSRRLSARAARRAAAWPWPPAQPVTAPAPTPGTTPSPEAAADPAEPEDAEQAAQASALGVTLDPPAAGETAQERRRRQQRNRSRLARARRAAPATTPEPEHAPRVMPEKVGAL